MSEADRIRWHCRRGMLELDLVLAAFLEQHFDSLGPRSLATLRTLLELPDPELFDLVMGRGHAEGADERELVALMRG
jgi:succinate dehydrogenase flavin-adding protein (antitoxin of CptAB toxin-antitoxin module)